MNQLADWHIAVLIPARNEEDLLPRCLASVDRARRALPPGVSCEVVVVADASTDGTLAIAKRMLRSTGVAVASDCGIVGQARALAAGIALGRCPQPFSRCWLANTDADCEVPARWLLDQLLHAEAGAEALAGVVSVDSFAEHLPHVPDRFRETYLLHGDGTHPHVHGANLGVRADVYLADGGWAGLATAEDHDLWARLRTAGRRCLSLASMSVVTSGRIVGRAPHGFANALASHNEVATV